MIIKTIAFLLVVFLTNILQTITGFAGTALAMPFCILLLGKSVAAPLNNITAILVSVYILIRNHKNMNFKKVLYMLIFMGIGMILGWQIESLVDAKILYTIYGIVVILISLFFLIVKKVELPKLVLSMILVIAGAIHFIFISGGPLVVIVATILFDDVNEFRSSLAFVWIILNSVILTKDIILQSFNLNMIYLLGLMVICVALAIVLGQKLLKKLNKEQFLKTTYILLLLSGVTLLLQ